jgi:dTDP-4-dehydrorhamnose reductase
LSDQRSRLLIIGAGGFVGSWLAARARGRFHVIRGARRHIDSAVSSAASDKPDADEHVAIDITQVHSVAAAFAAARPEIVVLTAALADIDRCQREREQAELVNYMGPLHVARACARHDARLLFTSTDAVFDGTKGFYREDDPPTPPNFYGETKARAETAVLDALPDAAVVRLSLVLGRSLTPGTNSFLDKFAAALAAGQTVDVPTYEVRNPIDVATLAELLLELAAVRSATGLFHIGSTDKMCRFELSRRLAEALGYDPALVAPRHAPAAGQVPRGLDDFLSTERVRRVCHTPLPSCREVIERAVHAVA